MGTELPKTLYTVHGKAMLDHIIGALAQVPELQPPVLVVGHGAEHIKAHLGPGYQYAHQVELSGTATAVKSALPYLPEEGYVFVLYGDQPFQRVETFEAMIRACRSKPAIVQTTVTLPDFEDWRSVFKPYGRMLRDAAGNLQDIVEYKNASDEQRALTEVNPGLCAVDAAWLRTAIMAIEPSPTTGEYYLTGLLAMAAREGRLIETVSIGPAEALGVNSPADAAHVERVVPHEHIS